MFDNAAMHTDLQITAKQAEMMASLVERDQVRDGLLQILGRTSLCLGSQSAYYNKG